MASETAPKPTACLALADGTLFYGYGFGATGQTVAELCFNTAMTGYQEIMTDPSYAGQIVTFTFPHIGNTGVTDEDDETADPWQRHGGQMGPDRAIKLACPIPPFRLVGPSRSYCHRGIDTRRLTRAIRMQGAPHCALAHDPDGNFDTDALVAAANHLAALKA